jgi:heme exporter protein D
MIVLGPNAVFIIASYLGVALVVTLLILWTILDSRLQGKRLAALEADGIRRRSQTVPGNKMDKTS